MSVVQIWEGDTTQVSVAHQSLDPLYTLLDCKIISGCVPWTGGETYFSNISTPAERLRQRSRSMYPGSWASRRSWVTQNGWTWLTQEVLEGMLKLDPERTKRWIDIGAGTGFVAAHLRNNGVDIEAYENYTHLHDELTSPNYVSPDRNGVNRGVVFTHDAVEKIKPEHDIIVLNWPPYDDNLALNVVNKMVSGQILIYSGEGDGGCTGCYEFHNLLDEEFEDITEQYMYYPGFHGYGVHDWWWFYVKK